MAKARLPTAGENTKDVERKKGERWKHHLFVYMSVCTQMHLELIKPTNKLSAMSTGFPVSRGNMQALQFSTSTHSLLHRLIQTWVLCSSQHVVHEDYCSWHMRDEERRPYCSFFFLKIRYVCSLQVAEWGHCILVCHNDVLKCFKIHFAFIAF